MFPCITAAIVCVLAQPDVPGQVDWHVGKAFRRQIDVPVSVVWSQVPLREALQSVARSQQTALMIDRRVDPGQLVEFTASGLPLLECLREAGQKYGFSVTIVDSVLYVGPATICRKLATLDELRRLEVNRLPAVARALWQRKNAVSWQSLAEPRQLLAQVSQQSGIVIEGREALPHDLWPGASLPEMPVYSLLTVLLAGFDMTFQLNPDGSCSLVPMPAKVSVKQSYRTAGRTARLLELITQALPESDVSRNGARIIVDGTFEDHETVRNLLSGNRQPLPETRAGELRYTLDGKNQPVGPFLTALGRRLGLRVEFAPDAQPSFDTMVTFQVKNATRDELLSAVLAPAHLSFEVDKDLVRVRAGR